MMNKLKNRRRGLIRNWTVIHQGWVDLNFRSCLDSLRGYPVCDRKNLIADTNMQYDFGRCKQ
jgi:hypothetical protein